MLSEKRSSHMGACAMQSTHNRLIHSFHLFFFLLFFILVDNSNCYIIQFHSVSISFRSFVHKSNLQYVRAIWIHNDSYLVHSNSFVIKIVYFPFIFIRLKRKWNWLVSSSNQNRISHWIRNIRFFFSFYFVTLKGVRDFW